MGAPFSFPNWSNAMQLDLNMKPFVAAGITHNTLRLSLDYDKNKKGPVLRLQMAQCDPPENGFSSFKMAIFGSPSSRVVIESGWKMNNKKRLEAAWDQVAGEIAGKRGASWAAVEALLKESGAELVEEPVAA